MTDISEDEATRFLDLAAYADGRLDAEEHERVAAALTADRDAAEDVRAACTLAGAASVSTGLERVIERASALVLDREAAAGRIIPLTPRPARRLVQMVAQWGSLAAAIAIASWLGFAMGTNTSLALSEPRQPGDSSFLPELFESPVGFLRDLGEGLRT